MNHIRTTKAIRTIVSALLCAAGIIATATIATGPAAAALPATSAGNIDPYFAANGISIHAEGTAFDAYDYIDIQHDGRYVVRGYLANTDGFGSYFARRINVDGSHDASFGDGGRLLLMWQGSHVDAQGRLVSFGGGSDGATLTRFSADGVLDTAFGVGGTARVQGYRPGHKTYGASGVAIDAAGRYLVVTQQLSFDDKSAVSEIWRLGPDGQLDTTYGTGGRRMSDQFGYYVRWVDIAMQANGRAIVRGECRTPTPAGDTQRVCLFAFDANGNVDPSFASGGVYIVPQAEKNMDVSYGMAIDAADRILLDVKAKNDSVNLMRLKPDGTIDNGFGVNGSITRIQLETYEPILGRLIAMADGRILWGGETDSGPLVMRFLSNGAPDASFGNGGRTILPLARSGFRDLALAPDGKIVGVGRRDGPIGSIWAGADSLVARLLGDETKSVVTEFYNTALNHYFITSNPDEAAAIDGGAAGPGWARTGDGFKSGGPDRVCRFYGSPDIDAATGARRGPNSHFYTINATECGAVRQDAGWKFESHDFNAWPAVNGACAAGTIAVKRAYNARYAVNDSNHRYTTSDAVYAAMLASGWTGEGIVFCALE